MANIAVLPPHLSNLIAAGEVVERPASVVKELLENAIDAGASVVTVEIKRGGVSFIRVSDNGCGMDADNAARAFLRHATSKLRSEADLAAIRTLGFRGEALAAIAACSRIDLMTRRPGDDLGLALTLEAGAVTDTAPSGCPVGTTIVVRDLFYNTPARGKFLKKDATEGAHVQETVLRAALGHPEVSICLIKDGNRTLHTPGDGVPENAVYTLFGREFADGLLPAQRQEGVLSVNGFIGKPEAARSSRSQQFFHTLGRPVRCRTLTAALEEGYSGAMMQGRYPVCILHLTMPPESFDINVHPAKAEIKFVQERAVFDMVFHTVKTALDAAEPGKVFALKPNPSVAFVPGTSEAAEEGREGAPKSAGSPSAPMPSGSAAPPLSGAAGWGLLEQLADGNAPLAVADTPLQEGVYAGTTVYTPPPFPVPSPVPQDPVPSFPVPQTPPLPSAHRQAETVEAISLPDWRYIGEALGGYLLVESAESLWIIDKHAAHERLLYNRLREQSGGLMSQQLLAPVMVTLSAPECDILLSSRDFLERAGFAYDAMGPGTLAVRAAPDAIDLGDIPALMSELAGALGVGRKPDLREKALHMIACKGAVKLGRSSNQEDMRHLCKQVMETHDLRHCPHGRPVAVRISRSELGKQFMR